MGSGWVVLASYSQRRYSRTLVGHVVVHSSGSWAALLDGEYLGAFEDDADARDAVDRAYASKWRGVGGGGSPHPCGVPR